MGDIIQIAKNNYSFEELKHYFEHKIYMKVQQGYVLKYLNLELSNIHLYTLLVKIITSKNLQESGSMRINI